MLSCFGLWFSSGENRVGPVLQMEKLRLGGVTQAARIVQREVTGLVSLSFPHSPSPVESEVATLSFSGWEKGHEIVRGAKPRPSEGRAFV